MSINSVFVYGTLKQGRLRSSAWPRRPLSIREGMIQADLHDLGPYPAIVEGTDFVLGEVWLLAEKDMSETLRVLDEFENYSPGASDNQYLRQIVEVELPDGEQVSAFVYFAAKADQVRRKRKILPSVPFGSHRAACWPDEHASVPGSFAEEDPLL
jgi:gamma-glutamylcyclotransferase (GGCT)/AIG2-like uncharacterized protein YtfP